MGRRGGGRLVASAPAAQLLARERDGFVTTKQQKSCRLGRFFELHWAALGSASAATSVPPAPVPSSSPSAPPSPLSSSSPTSPTPSPPFARLCWHSGATGQAMKATRLAGLRARGGREKGGGKAATGERGGRGRVLWRCASTSDSSTFSITWTHRRRGLVTERSAWRGRGEGPAHLVRHTEVLDRVPPDIDLRQLEELIPVLRPPRQLSPAPREKET